MPSAASAQPPTPTAEQRQEASRLYSEGQTHFQAQRWREAQTAFQAAYAVIPNPAILLAIASTQEQLGDRLEAARTLRRYLRDRPNASDRATVEGRIQTLDPNNETVEAAPPAPGVLRIDSVPTGAAIAVDGQDSGRVTPASVEVEAGSHEVVASLEGYESATQTVTVEAGATVDVALTLTEAEAAEPAPQGEGDVFGETTAEEDTTVEEPPAPVEEAPAQQGGPSAEVWVITAIAGVALITGSVFGFLALSAQSDFDASPNSDAADRGETFALVADLSLGLALAAGVTAIVLYATQGPGQPAPAASTDSDTDASDTDASDTDASDTEATDEASEDGAEPAAEEAPQARRAPGVRVGFAPYASPQGAGGVFNLAF